MQVLHRKGIGLKQIPIRIFFKLILFFKKARYKPHQITKPVFYFVWSETHNFLCFYGFLIVAHQRWHKDGKTWFCISDFSPKPVELGCCGTAGDRGRQAALFTHSLKARRSPVIFLVWSEKSWCVQGILLSETIFRCNAGKFLQCWFQNIWVLVTHHHSTQTKLQAKDFILQVLLTWMFSPDPKLDNVMWGRGNAVSMKNWTGSNHEKFSSAFVILNW